VLEAQQKIAQQVQLPAGYRLEWVGEFGQLQGAIERLEVVVPISLLLICVLLPSAYSLLAGYQIQALQQEQQRLATEQASLELQAMVSMDMRLKWSSDRRPSLPACPTTGVSRKLRLCLPPD